MRIAASAKVNLALRVLGKRTDGYHELEMVMHSLAWGDELRVELADEIRLSCSQTGVPVDGGNLVHRAIDLLGAAASRAGAAVHIEKRIPLEAGLAGGSADAAATLRALNELWDLNWSTNKLAEFSLPLGSDVPYCVHGGLMLARGRGERLSPLPPCPPLPLVLATPRVIWNEPKTAAVYRRFKREMVQNRSVESLLQALQEGDLQRIGRELFNDLEPVASALHPVIREMKIAMCQAGALGAVMSGAGPTVVALVEDEQGGQAVAETALRFTDQVVVTHTR